MIRIRTGSRLHFGLFSVASEQAGPLLNLDGEPTIPRRQFGGVGLMVEHPGIDLTVSKAANWAAEGPLASRALQFAQTYCAEVGWKDPFAIQIESAAPEHVGLGTGTQLGLAIGQAICVLTGQPDTSAGTQARRIGRGLRSSVGIWGFELGGFLVEAGKSPSLDWFRPLAFRIEFNVGGRSLREEFGLQDWRIVLVLPREITGIHGRSELAAFAQLAKMGTDDKTTDTLCRLVLLGMIPALQGEDMDAFGEALYDFNRRAGKIFEPAQGGIYAHPRIEEIVQAIRGAGIKGVGQSSWGPTIFAIVQAERVKEICDWLVSKTGITREEIIVTDARNRQAEMGFTPT